MCVVNVGMRSFNRKIMPSEFGYYQPGTRSSINRVRVVGVPSVNTHTKAKPRALESPVGLDVLRIRLLKSRRLCNGLTN